MIHLFMRRVDGISKPIRLEIEEITYNYPEYNIFDKLEVYLNYKIQVTYNNEKPKKYVIKSVTLDGVPALELI